MKTNLVTLSSALILAIGLTIPAWAQLGRVGAGAGAGGREQGDLGMGHESTSSTERMGAEAGAKQDGMLKGSAKATTSTKAQLNAKNKTKVKANAKAGASAHLKVKKQKGQKNNPQYTQLNSNTHASVNASAGSKLDANTGAKVNANTGTTLDANAASKVQAGTATKVDANAQAQAPLR